MVRQTTTHKERLENCLAGERPDRTPVALWRHFPVDDQSPDRLAAAVAQFQHTFDFDLIKVTPASSFCTKDWGTDDVWKGNPEGTREYSHHPVVHAEDWEKLPLLDLLQGHLGGQIQCLRSLVTEFGQATPVLETIFSPLSQAKNLVGSSQLLVHMRKHPQALHAGLQRITETTIRFIEKAAQTGISGIFYAIQHAQYGLLSVDEFTEFEAAYDLRILESTEGLWLNLLHLHGEEVMFDRVLNFPVQVINWHDQLTPPSLFEAQKKYRGIVCGGLQQWQTMVLGTPDQIRLEARRAIEQTGGSRFILGTGCVLPITAPYGNIVAARKIVEDIQPG